MTVQSWYVLMCVLNPVLYLNHSLIHLWKLFVPYLLGTFFNLDINSRSLSISPLQKVESVHQNFKEIDDLKHLAYVTHPHDWRISVAEGKWTTARKKVLSDNILRVNIQCQLLCDMASISFCMNSLQTEVFAERETTVTLIVHTNLDHVLLSDCGYALLIMCIIIWLYKFILWNSWHKYSTSSHCKHIHSLFFYTLHYNCSQSALLCNYSSRPR